ncbi:MAG TPA: pyrroline-5-carboxylate reductase [Acidimicrobiales bacterium]|nr:pyrroline-5-carboxylate reductase [Acidimicrobiales bacterium]
MKLVISGGGKMGEALLAGVLRAQWCDASEVAVAEPDAERRAVLARLFTGVHVADAPVAADGAIIAVKPGYVVDAASALAGVGVRRVLSIAAGVSTATIESALPAGTPVVRAMPNTPALIGAGAAAIAPGETATDDDVAWAESILSAVGIVERVDEALLDAVTGLSGSGPAYVFLVAEAMIAAGDAVGLPHETAVRLAIQTVMGAGRMLAESGQSPEELRAAVSSPNGTTVAGLGVLDEREVRDAFRAAVVRATQRSQELGRGE